MLFWIIFLVLIILVLKAIIPLRLWIAQSKAKYSGKAARRKIEKIKNHEHPYNEKTTSYSNIVNWKIILFTVFSLVLFWKMAGSRDDNNSVEQNTPHYNSDVIKNDKQETIAIYGKDDNYVDSRVDEANSFYNTGIVFPDSSSRRLSDEEIESLEYYSEAPEKMIEFAINEIYARNGYEFKEQVWKYYYNEFSWYHNLGYSDDEARERFNKYEKENVDKLATKRKQIKNR